MRPNQLLLWIYFMLLSSTAIGQSSFFISPNAMGKGGVGVADNDSWSSIINPAGTAQLKSANIAVAYHLPYFVDELSYKSISGILPFKFGVIAASVNQYGFSLYQENTFNLAYARGITSNLDVAFQFNYLRTHISQSGSGGNLYAGLGLRYAALENLVLACYISNPEKANIQINDEVEKITSLFVLGFKWLSSDNFNVSAEVEKQTDLELIYKLGLEYSIKNRVWLRTGILGKPSVYTMGLGFNVHHFNLDTGIAIHPSLGVSSCFGISYQFNKK